MASGRAAVGASFATSFGMEARAQVLVVGAGPVGLMAALHLKRRGVDVRIVEQNERGAVKSFAVVLHPRTVAMLGETGIVEPIRWQGHSFRRVAVFARGERQALLTMPVDGALAYGGLTLPQDVLRTAIEADLRAAGVEVDYGVRLSSLEQSADEVACELETAPASATGAAASNREALVTKFVLGADGFLSSVRERLGIALLKLAPERPFAFFDVPQPPPAGNTAELAFGDHASAMYPLRGELTRYTFELPAPPTRPLGASELGELHRARMPWHAVNLERIEWSGVRSFQPALAERFGRGRVWLLGDACHGANPIGAHSVNVGLREARDLTTALVDCLEGRPVAHLSSGYAEQRRLEWHRLLAVGTKVAFAGRTPSWAARHVNQLASCLPASGDDLDDLLAQLGINVL